MKIINCHAAILTKAGSARHENQTGTLFPGVLKRQLPFDSAPNSTCLCTSGMTQVVQTRHKPPLRKSKKSSSALNNSIHCGKKIGIPAILRSISICRAQANQ
jgi:hypothetical protein